MDKTRQMPCGSEHCRKHGTLSEARNEAGKFGRNLWYPYAPVLGMTIKGPLNTGERVWWIGLSMWVIPAVMVYLWATGTRISDNGFGLLVYWFSCLQSSPENFIWWIGLVMLFQIIYLRVTR